MKFKVYLYSVKKFSGVRWTPGGQNASNIVKLNEHRSNVRLVNISVKFPNISNTKTNTITVMFIYQINNLLKGNVAPWAKATNRQIFVMNQNEIWMTKKNILPAIVPMNIQRKSKQLENRN